ncbi:MAG: hybrid sensor histidine kinase/response regulator [Chlamydiota bacterium]
MDINEEEFIRRLKETFQVEAVEHLQVVSNGLIEMEQSSGNEIDKELIDRVFREAHNLKGASRAVNHILIQDICQSLETVLSKIRSGKLILTPLAFDVLYHTIDLIKKFLPEDGEVTEAQSREVAQLIKQLDLVAEGKEPTLLENTQSDCEEDEIQINEEFVEEVLHQDFSENLTIRVSTNKLDKLLQQIEEMLTLKITSGQRLDAVEELLKKFEKWNTHKRRIQKDVQTLKQLTIKQGGMPFKNLSNTFNTLVSFLNWQEEHLKEIHDMILKLKKESLQDYRISGSIVDSLFEETKEVLMQPCQTLFDSYPRMVRDISRSIDKEVDLEIQGAEIEIDRRILEEMKDPMMHLIRNSIDHGIESAEQRKKAGKPAVGSIVITVTKISGGKVELSIRDDGSGVNVEKVKQSALKNEVIHPKDLKEMDDSEAIMLMFHAGVSTSDIVTDISGRGVGMEVVNEKVEKLGGRVFINTERDKGTEFKIHLPLSLATFRGVHLLVEDQGYVIPTHYLLRVLRISKDDVRTVEGKESIKFDGKYISYVKLSSVLGFQENESKGDSIIYVLVVKALEITLAIGVDKILNEQEIFVKGLGKQLARVKNIADATVMDWGKVVPILDPSDIVKSVIIGAKSTTLRAKTVNKGHEEKKKTILIAEDTVTARMLLKNILDASGYTVKTAIDGVEAFSLLSQEKIDLLLSDIEMPRMTGFELVEKVRGTENLKDLPIVLCSSLCTKEDKERGIAVGANAYIVKSSFEQSNLLETIQKLL